MATARLRGRRISVSITWFFKPYFRFVLHVFVHLKGLGSVRTTWSKLRMPRVAPLPGSIHSHYVVRASTKKKSQNTRYSHHIPGPLEIFPLRLVKLFPQSPRLRGHGANISANSHRFSALTLRSQRPGVHSD